jgi:putative tryptophan/tyrosine transport system substrate-binding protein
MPAGILFRLFRNAAESARGISPRASHRSGHDTLVSSGSCHRAKAAAFRREFELLPLPVGSLPTSVTCPLRSTSITPASSLVQGGNLTGMTTLTLGVASKWLELLHELMPATSAFAVLINPTSPALAEIQSRDLQSAARKLGLQVHLLEASTDRDFDAAFARLVQLRSDGLVISSDSYFYARSEQLAALARRYAVPAICGFREFAMAGGLMSYGASIPDAHRWIGVYTGRVLKGEKPADLPVQQATKVELIINLKTAKALGLTVPLPLLGRADEVIE